MNKGFLSELENGKRHFPAGLTKQLNDALDTNFCEDEKRYAQARNYLFEIFQNFFLERTRAIETIYKKIEEQEEAIKDSYGFFVFLLMKLFYYLRVERVDANVLTINEIIDKNLRCLQKDEQSIYFCLLGIFYKRKTETNELALHYFLKSNSLCIPGSSINAMNTFQLISVYCELNQSIIAYRTCIECRPLLQMHNNYSRLITLDLFESATLIDLRLFNEAKEKLQKMLSSTDNEFVNYHTDQIYHNLAWNALLSGNYEECIQYTRQAIANHDPSLDLCYYIPFSLYKLDQFEKALEECRKAKSIEFYTPFLLSIQARIRGKQIDFENNIIIYYERLLINKVYEDILFVLKYMAEFYEEIGNTSELIKVYKDIDLFYCNKLDEFTSFLCRISL